MANTHLKIAIIQSGQRSYEIERETKVPHYLKIYWISENDFRCEKIR